jgi:hypothetical protein
MERIIKATRTQQMYRMRDYRSRKRLAELKSVIYKIKEKIAEKEITLTDEAGKIFRHALHIVEQI